MPTTNLTIRIDAELKKSAEELFEDLGMSMTSAITVFIRQSVRDQELPFVPSRKPNNDTIEAIREIQELKANPQTAKKFSSFADLLADIEAEDSNEI